MGESTNNFISWLDSMKIMVNWISSFPSLNSKIKLSFHNQVINWDLLKAKVVLDYQNLSLK
jgi:hypothetical protein